MWSNTIKADGKRLIDGRGRHAILRGVNLGGDCKIPYPDGGTHHPSDFSDHRTVSFIGRPFPLAEADAHLARIAGWGFNVLRLLVTWEAVAHAGPAEFDEEYLDYIRAVAQRAEAHGFAIFIDFHQDVWSRMSGGDGAPGWTFEMVGLDFRKFDAANAAHVMQRRYDYASPQARQEQNYPMMSWSSNYRLPANGIMWTAFFAGALLTPEWRIDGQNVQDYLQGHYLGAMAALAERVADVSAVIGFDSLNEPSFGWIGQGMSERQLAPHRAAPTPVKVGPCLSPFDALQISAGTPVEVPVLTRDTEGRMEVAGSRLLNPKGISIWLADGPDPFRSAGAWDVRDGRAVVLDEDFFRIADGVGIDPDNGLMAPFLFRVAEGIRAIRSDWLLLAEMCPYQFEYGRGFPDNMPEGSVNASHWYDVNLLRHKRSNDATAEQYRREIEAFHESAGALGRTGPSLLGEFGIPYDLDGAEAYKRWSDGERSSQLWDPHSEALSRMYDALDALLLSSTQWNYTASNSNDLRVGDGWNQEDLSIFSRDQLEGGGDGARGLPGFSRPYVQRAQGRILAMRFDTGCRRFEAEIEVDLSIAAPTEIFIPPCHYPDGIAVTLDPYAEWRRDAATGRLFVYAAHPGRMRIVVE